MRILIDECVDPRVKLLLSNHSVATVHEQGWDAEDDNTLLALAQRDFDVLLTIDRGLEFQQNFAKFDIGVLVVHVPKNQLAHYRMIQEEILAAVKECSSGRIMHVRSPL
jgi:predicted nuclease of predicted toxin-antitoxin system